jgi:hypothetical protein
MVIHGIESSMAASLLPEKLQQANSTRPKQHVLTLRGCPQHVFLEFAPLKHDKRASDCSAVLVVLDGILANQLRSVEFELCSRDGFA